MLCYVLKGDFPVNDNGSPNESDSKPSSLADESELETMLRSADSLASNESGAADPYRSAVPVEQSSDAMGALSANEIAAGGVWLVFCAAIFFYLPGVGITLLVLSLPVLVRTAIVVARRRHDGEEFSSIQKIGILFGSAALISLVVFLVVVCVSGGVLAGCFAAIATSSENLSVMIAEMVAGGIAGLLLGVWACARVIASLKRARNR